MLVIFDWDGTISDTAQQIVQATQSAAAQYGLLKPSGESIEALIGMSMPDIFNALWPTVEHNKLKRALDHYYQTYRALQDRPAPLFSGALNLFDQLNAEGHTLAVSTGNCFADFERIITQQGVAHYFSAIRCADESISKPHPRMLTDILDELSHHKDDVLFVGDTHFDMQLGNAAGVKTLGVSFGTQSEKQLQAYQPLAVINHLSQVLMYIH